MNDKKFIELLNLYVDREIGPEDALRLEAEVSSNPERRRVHDQYCRLQKACTMLAGELASSPEGDRKVVGFPSQRSWHPLQILAGLAAAACLVAVVGLRDRGAATVRDTAAVALAPAPTRDVANTVELASTPDAMRPVFLARFSAAQPAPGMYAANEASSQIPQLNWIGDVHLTPVISPTSPLFNVDPKSDLKAAVLNDSQNPRDLMEPVEMTAFRFQR